MRRWPSDITTAIFTVLRFRITFELIQMDMDGTNHRVITQLPKQYDLSGGSSGGGSYFFDNGYLIFLAFPSTSNPDYALPVYKIQLETGETTQMFQEDIPLHTVWPADGVSISNGYIYFPCLRRKHRSSICRG